MGIKKRDFGIGSWRTQDQYSVIGEPQSFYVWVREGKNGVSHMSASGWINGDLNTYHKLKNCLKNRKEFISEIKRVYYANKKKD